MQLTLLHKSVDFYCNNLLVVRMAREQFHSSTFSTKRHRSDEVLQQLLRSAKSSKCST